jgi:hypothetical protein
VRGDSSFRLDTPEMAVAIYTVSVTMEHGIPIQVVRKEKQVA